MQNVYKRYFLAIAVIAFATIVRLALTPWLESYQPFFTYYLAIIIIARFAGLWPSMFAAIAGAALSAYFFMRTQFSFSVEDWRDLLELAIYFFVSILSAVLIQKSQDRAKLALERQHDLQREVEQRKAIESSMKVANDELLRTKCDLEAANRAKDEFLAICSHELRTPMTPILGWTRMLRSKKFDEQTVGRGLEIIERNVKAQSQLIEDLLDVSRIIAGKMRLNVRQIELAEVIKAAMETVQHATEAKGIVLESSLDPRASGASGDSSRLQQVVWNILSNAIKFTPSKGRIEIRLSLVGTSAEISIADNGEGLAPEFIPFMFNRFSQAETGTARPHGGLGLGLAIVRHLVELHGGTVRAESEGKGKGARFTVTLPILKSEVEGPTYRTPRGSDTVPYLQGLSVLVVDDDADSRDFISVALEQWGANVTTVASARAAFVAIERSKPDVLVSDIGMPIEDGHALIKRLRERPKEAGGEIPAVALTAYARAEDRMRILEEGFQTHVPKPVEPGELAIVVARVAGRM